MTTLEHSTNGHAVPTFSIFKGPNSHEKVESLKYCFMARLEIDTTNPPAIIKAEDGWVYTAVYDSRLPVTPKVACVVSFQQHTYGRFAIIRTVKDY